MNVCRVSRDTLRITLLPERGPLRGTVADGRLLVRNMAEWIYFDHVASETAPQTLTALLRLDQRSNYTDALNQLVTPPPAGSGFTPDG